MIPTRFRPSGIYYEDGTQTSGTRETFFQFFKYGAENLRVLFVAIILTAIAVSAGTYSFRILNTDPRNLTTILDAILKHPPPILSVWLAALFTGVIFGFIFFAHQLRGASTEEGRSSGSTKFLAGLFLTICFDIYFFRIGPKELIDFETTSDLLSETLLAQGVVILLLLIMIPLFQSLISISTSFPVQFNIPPWLVHSYGWIRFLVVSFLLILAITSLSILDLAPERALSIPPNGMLGFLSGVTDLMAAAFFASLITAAILYWPPKFRQIRSSFGLIRFIIVVGSIAFLGLLYREITMPDNFLLAILISAAATVISVPLQRSLS